MAGTIVHHIVAKRILKEGNYSKEFSQAFLFGTHGPDFLFFKETDEKLGHILHMNNAKKLFNNYDIQLINKSEYYKGYAYGLMLHYYIDRYVHQYVGYLVNLDNYPGRHALTEATFDTVMYKEEYNEPINNLNFKKEYQINDNLIHEITSFYQDLNISDSMTFDYINKAWKKMILSTSLMLKPNPILLFFIKLYEKIKNKGTFYSSHFFTKDMDTLLFMNNEHKSWDSLYGKDTHSFKEILEIGMNDYRNEIKKINYCILNKMKYEFNNPVNFDGEFSK